MSNEKKDFIGKTNKELIIELMGHVETIHTNITIQLQNIKEQISESRPVCFQNENDIIAIRKSLSSWKWFIATIAILAAAVINILINLLERI